MDVRRPTAGDAIPNHHELPFHGADFAATLLGLTEQFGHEREYEALVAAFEHFCVAATNWPDVLEGREVTWMSVTDLEAARQSNPQGMALVGALLRRGHHVGPADVGRVLMVTRISTAPTAARGRAAEGVPSMGGRP